MKKVWCTWLALTLAIIACNQQIATGGPTPEYPPIPVSTQSAQALLSKFSSLSAASGDITLSISEAEMTSYLAQQIATQQGEVTLTDPQAYFRDGKMKLYAKVISPNLTANALLVINASVNDGQLKLTVEKADIGPLPVSNDLLNNLTQLINDQLLATLNKLPKGVKIKTVTIKDGSLTVTASVTK